MLRKFICAFAVLALAFTSTAQGGNLSSHLTFDRIEDVLDDDSTSLIVDMDGDMAISVGDILFGVMRIGSTTANGVLDPTDQLIGVFSFQVTATTGAFGADPTVTISNNLGTDPLDGTGLSIDELFGTSFGTSAGAAVLSSDPNAIDITDLTPGDAIAALAGYALQAVLGFGTADDYLEIQSFRDFDDSGELDFSEFPTASPAGTFLGSETGGLSVLSSNLGGVKYLPVSSTHSDGTTVTTHDVGVSGTLFGARTDTPGGWSITDSTALVLNPVPEPGSAAIWGAIICVGVVARRRRNLKARA